MMKKQLAAREGDLTDKIEDLSEVCDDANESIDVIGRQLLEINKGNLKETYVLEDL